MSATRTPADRDPEAQPVASRFDYDAPGAVDAARPTIDALAKIADRVARKQAQRTEPAADTEAA